MSINACTINKQSINAACGIYSILKSDVINYTVTLVQGQSYGPVTIGTFTGGPTFSIALISGTLNGPGGTLSFTTDPGIAGNIYFGGLTTNTLGAFTGTMRLQGVINYVDVIFTVNVVEALDGGGQQQKVHPDTKVPLSIFKRQPDEDVEPLPVEMADIQVNVELDGKLYSQTLRRSPTDDIAIVTISGLKMLTDVIDVNIEDIKINKVE